MLRISGQDFLLHFLLIEKMTGVELYFILNQILVMLKHFSSEVNVYYEHSDKSRNNDQE